MISVIYNSFSPTKAHTHMLIASMASVREFTDGDYEIIVVDNVPIHRIRDDYGVLAPFTLIENQENKNVYESYNQGAAVAKGDYLVFIQQDVFCNERTINKLVEYLKEYDVAYPQQIELTREAVKKIYDTPDGEPTEGGWRDAGMLAITREAFDKSGGWPEEFHNLLGEAAYYQIIDTAGLSWTPKTNAIITHIKAGNNLLKEAGAYNEEMAHDAKILKEEYGIGA